MMKKSKNDEKVEKSRRHFYSWSFLKKSLKNGNSNTKNLHTINDSINLHRIIDSIYLSSKEGSGLIEVK